RCYLLLKIRRNVRRKSLAENGMFLIISKELSCLLHLVIQIPLIDIPENAGISVFNKIGDQLFLRSRKRIESGKVNGALHRFRQRRKLVNYQPVKHPFVGKLLLQQSSLKGLVNRCQTSPDLQKPTLIQ